MERFSIHCAHEIGRILAGIQKQNRLLRMRFDHTTVTAITTLLDVDIPNRRIVIDRLSLDAQHKMHLVMSAPRIGFETVMDPIGMAFLSEVIRPCEFENTPALSLSFPLKLMRFEKRDTKRIAVANCSLRIPMPSVDAQQRYAMTEIQDLSVSGAGFFSTVLPLEGAVGRVYPESFLRLPEAKPIQLDLEVRNSRPVCMPNGQVRFRLGCRFLNISPPHVALLECFVMRQGENSDRTARNSRFAC